jgi:CheY-like chemotaxis protein
MPKTADSSSTSKSITSYTRDVDESISLLRARVLNKRVSLYGFDKGGKDPIIYKTGQLLKASITNFLTNWYGLKVVPYGQPASFIVVDEETPTTLNKIINQAPTSDRRLPSILVLCSHTSRFDRQASQNNSKGRIGFVAKPIGPLKLARALQQCLDGAAPPIPTPGLLGPSRHSSGSEESNDLSAVFEELSLSPHGGEMLDNSRMAAGSDNARKAIESPTPNATTERTLEFPFPVDAEENASSSVGGSASNTSREKGHGAVGESETLSMNDCGKKKKENEKTELERAKVATPSTTLPLSSGKASTYSPLGLVSSNASSNPSPRTAQRSLGQPQLPSTKSSLSLVSLSEDTATSLPAQEKAPATTLAALPTPSLLLVDDNKINLSLLRTYMRKRHYTVVDEAENGLEAVRKVEERVRAGEGGYDIIFMDISMPVLDGFGATRQIRGIEKTQSSKAEEAAHSKGGKAEEGSVAPALIIALTGLASSRDQSEAFTSGFDLFLTKPVSFKEVGKMLDNWEANRERDIRGSGEEA